MTPAIVGVGQTPYRGRHEGADAATLMSRAVRACLADADMEMHAVDGIVASLAPDALVGAKDMDRASVGRLAMGKPMVRVNTGGTSGSAALLTAADYVRSGRWRVALAVGLERMGQATSAAGLFNTIFDPFFERDLPMSTITMASLRASMLMSRYGYEAEHWARIAVRNHRHARRNSYAHLHLDVDEADVMASRMLAWPIHLYEACPSSEGACAVLIVNEDHVGDRKAAWIRGTGSVTDTYWMGDRFNRPEGSLVDLPTLRLAAEGAFSAAGLRTAHDVDVVEIHAPFSSAEAMAYPALGLCDPEDGPSFALASTETDHRPVINPSGGPQAANPVSAAALIRVAECAQQVRGRAGEHQVAGARWALATGQGGATQFSTVIIVSSERETT